MVTTLTMSHYRPTLGEGLLTERRPEPDEGPISPRSGDLRRSKSHCYVNVTLSSYSAALVVLGINEPPVIYRNHDQHPERRPELDEG
ncbi:MAG: hypothetical protein MAG451_01963 [Anaerolineales bacterium]|nr:hypothetical protein [Anaerolineales bacterium]